MSLFLLKNKLFPDVETKILLYIFLAFIIINLLLLFIPRGDNSLLSTGDGPCYYSYIKSIVKDGDLDFNNEYAHYNYKSPYCQPTKTGLVSNPQSVGPAVFWIPFFLAADLISKSLNILGVGVSTDGFGYIYEGSCIFGSLIYCFIGLFITFRLLQRYFSDKIAFLSIFFFTFSSNLFYYINFEPSWSHIISILPVAAFVYIWDYSRENRKNNDYFLLGLFLGLATIVRWQNILISILLLIEFLSLYSTFFQPKFYKKSFSFLYTGLFFTLPFLLIISIQFIAWKIIYGSFLTMPQGDGYLTWFTPHLLEILFSFRHGFFSWTPIAIFPIIGWIYFYRKNAVLSISCIIIFFMQLYINSIVVDWWGQASFSQRRFIDIYPLFFLGLAAFINTLDRSKYRLFLYFLLTILLIWNLLFVIQYGLGFVPYLDSLTFKEMFWDKFTLPQKVFYYFFNK